MLYRIKDLADMAGVSVRTLHHYDQLGLLKPGTVTSAGYRLYGDQHCSISPRLGQVYPGNNACVLR